MAKAAGLAPRLWLLLAVSHQLLRCGLWVRAAAPAGMEFATPPLVFYHRVVPPSGRRVG